MHAAVRKITNPPGHEVGWSFGLTGPGLPGAGVPVTTTGTGAIVFAEGGAPVDLAQSGSYHITETVRAGWTLTDVVSGNARPITADLPADRCTFQVSIPADQDANAVYQCDFTNTARPTPPPTSPPAPPTSPPVPPGPPLPNTGADVSRPLTFAALLLAVGTLVLAVGMRRRRRH